MKKLFIYVMLCFLGLTSLNAQSDNEVVVGNDPYVDNDYQSYPPIDPSDSYSYSQNIYTADELGGKTGNILSVAFKFDTTENNVKFVNKLDVYIAHTEKQNYSNSNDWIYVTSSDKYFTGEVRYADHKQGWLTIELQKPFEYKGGNIVVCVDNNTAMYSDFVYFYRYDVGAMANVNPRSLSMTRNVDITPDNTGELSDYARTPSYGDQYTNSLVKFTLVSEDELIAYMGAPKNLVVAPLKSYEGDTVSLSWDAAGYTDGLLGYNVYVNDVKHNTETIKSTTYSISDLDYNMTGNEIYVKSYFGKIESDPSEKATVLVSGKSTVKGIVYGLDGTTPLKDAVVTFVGTDELGNEQTYTAKTSAEGAYSVEVCVGKYEVTAQAEELDCDDYEVVVEYGVASELNIFMHEIYHPVKWILATETDTTVDVAWNMGFSDADFEGFETGDFSTRDWKNDSLYPWVITKESYSGKYAIKSTCEKVDGGVSAIELKVEAPENGFLSFYHKVSSETKYDHGNFYVDSVLQTSIAGNREWRYVEVYVEKGTHTYRWEYKKDNLTDMFADAYFVDDITFYKETEVKSGWIGYDNGKWETSVGTGGTSATYFGVSFPVTVQYAGLTLSKIAVYDAEKEGETEYTANIYLGGDTVPQELVSTQKFNLSGKKEMVEVELSTPVTLDGTKPLWITLYCDKLAYPVPVSLQSEYLTTDWLSLDGKVWRHAPEYELYGTIMLRGYVEDANGKTRVLADTRNAQRSFTSKYNVYRKELYSDSTVLVAENISETKYVDRGMDTVAVGAYKWGVSAIYDKGESDILWSRAVDKDMITKLTVKVKTNNNDPVAGTSIVLRNIVEEEYVYNRVLSDETEYVFDEFHKGVYEVSVSKTGFSSDYEAEVVEIWDATSLECLLTEKLDAVANLYVSPTGYAMWEGSTIGDEFFFDFEDGSLDGWVTIDADGDNYNWMNSIDFMAPGSGHNSSLACATSMSYFFNILTPDNYLVTEKKYLIDKTSKLKFYVCAQDAVAAKEHYGVAISLASNDDANDFITIWEETLTEESNGNTRAQTPWEEKVIDLSQYAGQYIHIALRHFDCVDQFYINVDDISLESDKRGSRTLQSYRLYLDDKLVAENLTDTEYEFEDLTDGQTYTTKVVPIYSSGEGAEATYVWTKIPCDTYDGVTDFKAEYYNGTTTVEWTLPEMTADKNRKSRAGAWLKYDNGSYEEKIGLTYDGQVFEQFKWGVMFPASDVKKYAGQYITRVSVYDCEEYDGIISVYEGGSTEPETLLHVQPYTCTGVNDMVEIPLTSSVKVDGDKNIWIVLSSGTGKQPAAGCLDQGNANGRWIYYDEYYGWLDNAVVSMPGFTWMVRAYVTDDASEIIESVSAEVLGVKLYRNGVLVKKLLEGESYVFENAKATDEYTIRVVYGGKEGVSYYAMSCPQTIETDLPCPAPKNLVAYSSIADGKIGTKLLYPYVPATSQWFKYDDGIFVTGIGGESVQSFRWGVMFTKKQLEDYAGVELTKVAFFDATYPEPDVHSGNIEIYFGGETAPELLVHSQKYEGEGLTLGFTEVELSYPIPVSGDENIWIVMSTSSGGLYPAAVAKNCGDPNSRWISMDGKTWLDAYTDGGIDGSWMIRAFLTNERGESKALNSSSREPVLKSYNIYRGTSLDSLEVVATTKDKQYFDEVEKGTYYYQVTATYEEDGVECESEPAKVYNDETKDYVLVEVTAIGENNVNGVMIYPNPTNGNLNVNVEAMKRITIVNTIGQIVYDQEVVSDNEIIDMSQYETGIYMVRIVTEKGVAVKRVSVVR